MECFFSLISSVLNQEALQLLEANGIEQMKLYGHCSGGEECKFEFIIMSLGKKSNTLFQSERFLLCQKKSRKS
jgi:hypothetical protein